VIDTDTSLTAHHFHLIPSSKFSDIASHRMTTKGKMKIKREQEVIKKEEEEDDAVESSFRAGLSQFAYPSSPPSARRPPRRPSPDPDPNLPPSASLTVTVAVAHPPSVQQDGDPLTDDSPNAHNGSNNGESAQALRRSPRKRSGESRPSLYTGDGGGTPSRPSKKIRRRNTGAPQDDLSHLGGLPEHVAEDLDGTFPPNPMHARIVVYIKGLSAHFRCFLYHLLPLGSPHQCSFAGSSTRIPVFFFGACEPIDLLKIS